MIALPPVPDKIIKKLYLSNEKTAQEKQKLKEYGIKYILIIGEELKPAHPKVLLFKIQDFVYFHIRIEDSQNSDIEKYFEQAYM